MFLLAITFVVLLVDHHVHLVRLPVKTPVLLHVPQLVRQDVLDVLEVVEQHVQMFVEQTVLVDVLDVVDVEVIVLLHVLHLVR